MRSRFCLLTLLTTAGCWHLDVPDDPDGTYPFEPEIGAPEGWTVKEFPLDLQCPDGNQASFYLLYPLDKVAAPELQRELLPVAIVFHSGTFDYISAPKADAPTSGRSYQEALGGVKRIERSWAVERAFATLGLYPNDDEIEYQVGALPAALAAKGIATLMPINCWGDLWHNRSSVEQNNFEADFFLRNGRTAAEFAFLHATTAFPPGNPLDLPIGIDSERVYLVGLGEGARAVSELLWLREAIGDAPGPFKYKPAAIVLDSPVDDLRPYYDNNSEAFQLIRSGLGRIFPAGREVVMRGSLAFAQLGNVPDRTGILTSSNDSIPTGANDAAIAHLQGDQGPSDLWLYNTVVPQHVLSNADPGLAKAVADFLVGGTAAVDPLYR